jgi:hypothetical protein
MSVFIQIFVIRVHLIGWFITLRWCSFTSYNIEYYYCQAQYGSIPPSNSNGKMYPKQFLRQTPLVLITLKKPVLVRIVEKSTNKKLKKKYERFFFELLFEIGFPGFRGFFFIIFFFLES